MRLYEATLQGVGGVMFGKPKTEPKREDETHDQNEMRTWKEKVNIDQDGHVILQPFALKNALVSAAKWRGEKIPGEGKKTWTQRFKSGLLVVDPIVIRDQNGKPMTIDDIDPQRLFVPSSGQSGGGTRVWRVFPTAWNWQGQCAVHCFDDKIDEKVMRNHLVTVGKFIGFGAMRVENGGITGRFEVTEFKHSEIDG